MDIQIMKQVLDKIKEYQRIIIFRHIRPDGDAVGSTKGLREILRLSFPEKEIYAVGDELPSYLSELGEIDIIPDDYYKEALVIVVDTNRPEITECPELLKMDKMTVVFDHHRQSTDHILLQGSLMCYVQA